MINTKKTAHQLNRIGYAISVIGIIVLLIWIGLFKFTPTEAKSIEPLVSNHFLMSWMYDVFSLQTVSNIIGTTELLAAVGLILSFWNKKAGVVGATLLVVMFLTTLSFLITTPDMWKLVDNFLVTDFFILKDLPVFGMSLMILARNLQD